MTAPAPRLRVLSFNCWGLKYVAQQRRARLLAIADALAASASASARSSYHSTDEELPSGYDVVALQEIWCQEDFEVVSQRAKAAGLRYSKFFFSGAVGSGLAILSQHPILASFVHPYSLSGYPLHFIEGDFFAAKAVCGISIDVAGVGPIQVLNTHLYAPGGEADGLEGAHRVAQGWELAKLVRQANARGAHVILMGDLNTQPHSALIQNLLAHGSLNDSFAQTHDIPPPLLSPEHLALTPVEALHAYGITCDSPLNSYSAPKLAKKARTDEVVVRGGKRLDYVLYRSPETSEGTLAAETAKVTFISPVAGLGCSYSDHFGLEVTLSLLPLSATHSLAGRPLLVAPTWIAVGPLLRCHSLLASAYAHSLASSRKQLQLLGLAILLIPVIAIAASFEPLRYLSWIFVLLGVADGAVGATMLYSGFVGGRWEAGSLRNVLGEMEDELARLEGKGAGPALH